MRLTNALKRAGVVAISNIQNNDGSWSAVVQIEQIDVRTNGTNFRTFAASHKNDIIADFDPKSVQNPILWLNGKGLQTIDGRHTLAALFELGWETVIVNIHFGITKAEAAAIFYRLDKNTKRMSVWDSYASGLEGNFDTENTIETALNKAKLSTPKTPGFNNATADVTGFTALQQALQSGPKVLEALLAINKVWKRLGVLNKDAKGSPMQRALVDYLCLPDHAKVSTKVWVDLFKDVSPERIIQLARLKKTRACRSQFKVAIEEVLEENAQHNRRRFRLAA